MERSMKVEENFLEKLQDMWGTISSALIALLRLCFLTVTFFISGVSLILFTRTEICNIEIRGNAFRCDREKDLAKLAFVDKLLVENPDLLAMTDENAGPNCFSDDDIDEDDGGGDIT